VLAAGQVPAFSFTPTGDGTYTVRLSVDDVAQTTNRLLALNVGNVLPQNLSLFTPSGNVPIGQTIVVSGGFTDPGADPWQASLIVRDGANQATLLRLPLVLSNQQFSTSLVFEQQKSLELFFEVNDGTLTVTSPSIMVLVGQALAGDFDRDGDVDHSDHGFWRANFGATAGSALQADANGNGIVDAADYVIWRKILSNSPGSGAAASEPDNPVGLLAGSTTESGKSPSQSAVILQSAASGWMHSVNVAAPLDHADDTNPGFAQGNFPAPIFLHEPGRTQFQIRGPARRASFERLQARDRVFQSLLLDDMTASSAQTPSTSRRKPALDDFAELRIRTWDESSDSNTFDAAFDVLGDELAKRGRLLPF
jgi:hypothetical protein